MLLRRREVSDQLLPTQALEEAWMMINSMDFSMRGRLSLQSMTSSQSCWRWTLPLMITSLECPMALRRFSLTTRKTKEWWSQFAATAATEEETALKTSSASLSATSLSRARDSKDLSTPEVRNNDDQGSPLHLNDMNVKSSKFVFEIA